MIYVVTFYILYISGFVISLMRNPVYAFYLYEVIYFFSPPNRWWGSMMPELSYSYFVVLLMITLLAFNYKNFQQNKLSQISQFKWMYVVVFIYLVTYFYAALPEIHYIKSIDFLKLAIIVSVAYKLCDSVTKLDYALYAYILGASYVGFLAFQTGRNSGVRVEGIGTVDAPDANGIAAAIAPALVLCLYYFWIRKSIWMKTGFAVAGIFIADGLILINSRGATLSVIAGMGYFMAYMYFSSYQRKYQKAMAVFITVAGLLGGSTLLDQNFIDRFKTIYTIEATGEKETGATRVFFWKAAWELSKDYPFGSGYHGFNYHAPKYVPEEVDTGRKRTRSVHSTWLEALTETGYPGLFAFVMMIYTSFRALRLCKKALQKDNKTDEYFKIIALEAAFFVFIIAMSFLNRFRAEILYWLILYSATAYNIYILKARAVDTTHTQNNIPRKKKMASF